ncbi:MAG: outer membrane lipoprotein carrier protein LolA [Pseudonocardia sp.]|nr:outer membrane lipoprotein carrier protein LolA [Pseudonocardia sp.]MBO0873341.1 outer membrane lipoprotein carrier protein LolA [Pseudonocardia sp.]
MSTVKITLVVSGAVALAMASVLVAAPFGAPAGPATAPSGATVPPIGADELIASIRNARPGPLAGTVWVDARLGPAASSRWPRTGPGLARLWSDGAGRRRVSVPDANGERTIVDDGSTVWNWSSATRSVTREPAVRSSAANPQRLDGPEEFDGPDGLGMLGGDVWGNPAAATNALLGLLASDSMATVEPAARVAGRDAYQLVLAPVPTERTMLREIRVAVDARTRLPLEVLVLANGLAEPALRIAFSQVSFGPQDPALFRFAPARGVAVRARPAASTNVTLVGKGWDTVLVRQVPDRSATDGPCIPRAAAALGSPVDGPWGQGRMVSTPIGTTVLTSDCRVATGAVPVQVITEALGRSAGR